MNPLTLVKRTQKMNSTEAALGISEEASWHAKYKDSAYVFIGGIPYELTEGDLLAVFAQYGEVVDVNLVRDKGTGKSKGFAFLAYEDQRSTILAVDNLNGAKVLGRILRVDHVGKYKKKEEEEDDEKEQQKREARGVCRAFQKGECTRGASCKFSHDEQRAANTGWGPQDTDSRWNHDKFDGPPKSHKKYNTSDRSLPGMKENELDHKTPRRDDRFSRLENNDERKHNESSSNDPERQRCDKISERRSDEKISERRSDEKISERRSDDRDRRSRERQSDRYSSDRGQVDDMDRRRDEKRSRHDGRSSPHYHRSRR